MRYLRAAFKQPAHPLYRRLLVIVFFLLPFMGMGQRVGLVLSGGGARGLAHIGVIRALEEEGIPIDYIAGTSMGAMVGGFYAAGYSPDELAVIAKIESQNWLSGGLIVQENYNLLRSRRDGTFLELPLVLRDKERILPENLFSDYALNLGLAQYLSPASAAAAQNFDSLMVPYISMASDIYENRSIALRTGNLAFAVRASMAVPFFFLPVSNKDYNNLYDGGVYNNFPVDVMDSTYHPDIIIGVYVANPPNREKIAREQGDIFDILLMQGIAQDTWQKMPVDRGYFIQPFLDNMSTTDFDRESVDFAIQRGYEATKSCMADLKAMVRRRAEADSLAQRRSQFRETYPPMTLRKLDVVGLPESQRKFAVKIASLDSGTVSFRTLERAYYRLKVDGNYLSTFPELLYDTLANAYDLTLHMRPAAKFNLRFGAAFFSPTDHRLEVGAYYRTATRVNFEAGISAGVGSIESFAEGRMRLQLAAKLPIYAEIYGGIVGWRLQQAYTGLIPRRSAAQINQTSVFNDFLLGINLRRGGRLFVRSRYHDITWKYYADPDIRFVSDTLDQTQFLGNGFSAGFHRRTLNKRQYPTQGSEIYIMGSLLHGRELFTSFASSEVDARSDHTWLQLTGRFQQYVSTLKIGGLPRLSFGISAEAAYSSLQDFSNSEATRLSSPAFMPLQDSPMLYLPDLYSKLYIAPGVHLAGNLSRSFSIRADLYLYQPFNVLEDGTPDFSIDFNRRKIVGSAGVSYDTFIGPVGLFVNYYENPTNAFRLVAHMGFLLFQDRPWD